MIPAWVVTTLVLLAGCILAIVLGSVLPDYGPYFDYYGIYIGLAVLACTIAILSNNFPMLLAVGLWFPFILPVAIFRAFPPVLLVLGWISLVLFLRMCMSGTINYTKSFSLFFLLCFAWVPIRFLMNPIHKLGASVEGGAGVSGAAPYVGYVISAIVLLLVGAILDTREKLFKFIHWSLWVVLAVGHALAICAFIPATGPTLYSFGVFAAGGMGEGILRLVQLPAYGIFYIQIALCPYLCPWPFRSYWILRFWLFLQGCALMILGGNRSTILAAMVAIPVILVLRRSTTLLLMMGGVLALGVITLRLSVDTTQGQISPLVRSLGMFDSKIDKATGGDASAQWRYEVWQDGLKKIMQNPLVGKGFGNLPKHLDASSAKQQVSGDFEVVLAGGEAHNGFVTAAYGFGIPFMAALTIGLFVRMFSQMRAALLVDRHDKELRDLYAFLASMYPAYFVYIYTSFDLSSTLLWAYVAMGYILDRVSQKETTGESASGEAQPAAAYMYPNRYNY